MNRDACTSKARASFKGLAPKSALTSKIARASSLKEKTKPEELLARALRKLGLTFTRFDATLPGRPDFVFRDAKLVVFVDGDFWHGRNWAVRKRKLLKGHNAAYWVAKIEGNIARDRRNRRHLGCEG